ncbi:MAG: glycoside hydrolase family 95-like protein, partial [Chloroflexota bacterium]
FFKASDDDNRINMSSVAPIFPMNVIAPNDERAISTANAYIERYGERVLGDGMHDRAFPWSAGVLGTILAGQGRGDLVWTALQGARPTICNFGGMTEVMENGEWNMQYFGTAQGACCTAIHEMLLQSRDDQIELFPALPSSWNEVSFERLRASGFVVSAAYQSGAVEWTAQNASSVPLTRQLCYGDHEVTLELQPGETRSAAWVR